MYNLLLLPHRLRLDLSVLLTCSILFIIPPDLLTDSLQLLCSTWVPPDDVRSIARLPSFARTAVVNLCRRICRREMDEVAANGFLLPKPSRERCHSSSSNIRYDYEGVTFLDAMGFQFLRPIKWYLSSPIDPANHTAATAATTTGYHYSSRDIGGAAADHFSPMEVDIMHQLPDSPSACSLSAPAELSSQATYTSWVSIAARHAVLLINKAPSCPPLTLLQSNRHDQEVYLQLQPILQAAHMTLQDLDLCLTGPHVDGRMVTDAAGVLPFGQGLPRSCPSHLAWHVLGVDRCRKYDKPWKGETYHHHDNNNNNNSNNSNNSNNNSNDNKVEVEPPSPSNNSNSRGGVGVFLTDSITIPSVKADVPLDEAVLKVSTYHHHSPTSTSTSTSRLDKLLQQPPEKEGEVEGEKEVEKSPKSPPFESRRMTDEDSRSSDPSTSTILDDHYYPASSANKVPYRTHPIQGFSADARWDASFMLAPPSLVHLHNLQSGNAVSQSGNAAVDQKWSGIEFAPVVLTTTSVDMMPIDQLMRPPPTITSTSTTALQLQHEVFPQEEPMNPWCDDDFAQLDIDFEEVRQESPFMLTERLAVADNFSDELDEEASSSRNRYRGRLRDASSRDREIVRGEGEGSSSLLTPSTKPRREEVVQTKRERDSSQAGSINQTMKQGGDIIISIYH